jgi:dTDP-4-amino-4,6-dideoxygalactose transaminase
MADRFYDEKELESLKRWLDKNQDSQSEKLVSEFEERFAEKFGVKRTVAVNSAMGGLQLALQGLGVGPGDEVIVDPIVVFGAMAVLYVNAIPVFADIKKHSFNIDPNSVKEIITERTKAIICTHMFGSICDMDELLKISKEHNIPIIEDCAHALFAKQGDRFAGTFGNAGVFSFNHRKQLSTGQGGMMIVEDEELYHNIKNIYGFGRIPNRLCWNFSMPGIVAALGITQLEKAERYVEDDRRLARMYTEAIDGCKWLIPQEIREDNHCSYHIWSALYEGDKCGIGFEDFQKACKEEGADYFLFGFMPQDYKGIKPSPAYKYPIFKEPLAYKDKCPFNCHFYNYQKAEEKYPDELCPTAEYVVGRLFNTVLSPIREERVKRLADALYRAVKRIN